MHFKRLILSYDRPIELSDVTGKVASTRARCLDEWDVFLDSVNRATIGAELARFELYFISCNV